jgi:hypothetical protein
MSQLDTPPFDATAAGPQKTSGLAIAALVCSLICCIPITTIPGILLGIIALVSIGGDPAKKGKGMALVAIILGVVFTAGQAYVYPKGYAYFKEVMQLVWQGPSEAMTVGFAGDAAAFKGCFHGPGASASDAEAQAFIAALRGRYGEYVGCRFDEETADSRQPPFGKTSVTFPYVLEFDSGEVKAEAEIIFSDPVKGGFVNKLGHITVFDPDLGDLTYPMSIEEAVEEAIEEPVEEAIEGAIEEVIEEPAEEPIGQDGA